MLQYPRVYLQLATTLLRRKQMVLKLINIISQLVLCLISIVRNTILTQHSFPYQDESHTIPVCVLLTTFLGTHNTY